MPAVAVEALLYPRPCHQGGAQTTSRTPPVQAIIVFMLDESRNLYRWKKRATIKCTAQVFWRGTFCTPETNLKTQRKHPRKLDPDINLKKSTSPDIAEVYTAKVVPPSSGTPEKQAENVSVAVRAFQEINNAGKARKIPPKFILYFHPMLPLAENINALLS